jgi:predicted RNA-binding protein with PIN domain
MSRLIIDGYNLLHSSYSIRSIGKEETGDLIELLRRYKRQKSHTITMVLDGHEGGMPTQKTERIKGIAVIYSKLGEKADQVIERLVRQRGGSCVVVTSDRELADSVERDGAAVVGSDEFMERLKMAEFINLKGEVEPDEPAEDARIHTRKKGNPKRKSKKERARLRRIKKL